MERQGRRGLGRREPVFRTSESRIQFATIRKLDIATGIVSTVVGVAGQAATRPGMVPAGLNGPTGVAVLPTNQLVIVDGQEDSVLVLE